MNYTEIKCIRIIEILFSDKVTQLICQIPKYTMAVLDEHIL